VLDDIKLGLFLDNESFYFVLFEFAILLQISNFIKLALISIVQRSVILLFVLKFFFQFDDKKLLLL